MTAKIFSDAALMIHYLTILLSKAALKHPPVSAAPVGNPHTAVSAIRESDV